VSELIHIGRQGWQTVGYMPGFHAPQVNRWPRIVCGNVVLFRARWTFTGARLPPLTRGGEPLGEADFFLELARWRSRNGLPQHVFVHTQAEPKPFYVDLASPVLTDLLRRAVVNAVSDGEAIFHVTEMLPGPEELWVRDERGSYATEFLVQLDGPGNSS
jgi:Lantibiotic dehydratase, N terminus